MFSVHVCPQLVHTTEEVFHEDCVREGLTYGLQLGKEYLEAAHQRTQVGSTTSYFFHVVI